MKKFMQKVLIPGILIPVFGFAALFAAYSQTITQGDVNGDGTINIIDALMTAQYSVGLNPTGFNVSAADVNCDSTVNIVDALRIAQYSVGLVTTLNVSTTTATLTVIRTATPSPTPNPESIHTGNSTYFYNLGGPYGGCGLPQAELDSQNFVAVNVQNSPGDYATFHNRPIAAEYASVIGFFNNGLNCGRWVRVTINDFCNGMNDGAMNKPFCRDGTGWAADAYNGATLDMIVGDSCYDGNAWCRDDPNHLDLAHGALNLFVKDGKTMSDLSPDHFNNRKISWHFIESPAYTGDIRIGFMLSAQIYWPTVAISHLKNGIHGVDCFDGTGWVKAKMNGDMGQSYILVPTVTTNGTPGSEFRIRVYDVNDTLINNGRVYAFSFPTSCGTCCSDAFTEVTYTIE